MEDRQLLLAKQDYAGTREMLRRVGILGADPTKTWQVGQNSDDCRRKLVPSDFGFNVAFCPCGDFSIYRYDYRSGFRFTNVNIPQGSIINSAYLKLKASTIPPDGTMPDTFIEGEDSDNAATFSTMNDYDGRPRTSASVSWTPSAWVEDTWYTSPDIRNIIQEIVNRSGWRKGNALALFWRDADGYGGAKKILWACAYAYVHTDAPQLEVTWAEAPPIPLWKVGLVLLALFAGGAGAYYLTKGGEVYEL